jgi:hypothetical protein
LIVIFVDDIENFIEFLQLRIIDEIFYEIKELKHLSEEKNENQYEIILHFLAKLDTNTVLYETKLRILKSSQNSIDKTALDLLQKIFQQVDISLKLVKGKIREIFLSYSS